MGDLLELAEACVKATGPDRELDMEIHSVLDPTGHRAKMACNIGPFGPRYTRSLDAAMTLVVWERSKDGEPIRQRVFILDGATRNGLLCWRAKVFGHEAFAETPALALCAAALRAHHAEDAR